jgi:hypothetical protein
MEDIIGAKQNKQLGCAAVNHASQCHSLEIDLVNEAHDGSANLKSDHRRDRPLARMAFLEMKPATYVRVAPPLNRKKCLHTPLPPG